MNLATAIPEDKFTPQMALLYQTMSDISEECYCAGWMSGNEYRLWAPLVDPSDDRRYGIGEITPEDIEKLRWLSEQSGGWIVWGDDADGLKQEDWGPYFVPLDEWRARYAYETAPQTENTVLHGQEKP